jgi:hypothetical protein
MEFGFLIDRRRVVFIKSEIKPLLDFDDRIDRFYKHACASNGWVYPPLVDANQNFREKEKFKTKPQIPSSFFQIGPTHSITINPFDEEKAKFLILAYGFLNGVYLNPAGHLFVNRAAYEIGKLTGVILVGNDAEKGITAFSQYYDKASKVQRKLLFAILHWFIVGQTYNFEWDKFDAQYKVLDGLFHLSGLTAPNHASRPIELANNFGIKLPLWAQLNPDRKSSQLSNTRNELFHEARYAGQPIGYEYPKENFGLEFARFNSKIIVALVGLKTKFLQADPGNRDTWGWSFQ